MAVERSSGAPHIASSSTHRTTATVEASLMNPPAVRTLFRRTLLTARTQYGACVAVLLCCWILGQPARALASGGIEGPQAIALLNQQRQANGIPAIAQVDQNFAAAWCPNEDNGPSGGEITRDLSSSTNWSATRSPWDNAPLHQLSIYGPLWTTAGDVNNGVACMGLGNPAPPPANPTFYAWTSDQGPTKVSPTETVSGEGPFAPQELVGVPQGQPTGPDILLYAVGLPGEDFAGPNPKAISWSLAAVNGSPVPNVNVVDDSVATSKGYPGYIHDGGVMIPPPLAAAQTYNGTVTWQGPEGGTYTQQFSFTTTTLANAVNVYAQVHALTALITVSSTAPGPLLRLTGPSNMHVPLSANGSATVTLPPGTWTACASSGGGTSGYATAQRCTTFTVASPSSQVTSRQLTQLLRSCLKPHGKPLNRTSVLTRRRYSCTFLSAGFGKLSIVWHLVSRDHLTVASGALATPAAGKAATLRIVLTTRGIAITRRMSRVLKLLATATFTAPRRPIIRTSVRFELTR